jgi:hypothetical protein
MKTIVAKVSIVALAILLTCTAVPATAAPDVRIKLLNKLPTHLAVGESYTIDVRVSSSEPFILAAAMIDAYYPGRGVFSAGSDRASWSTEAVLHLTLTGKAPTADLPAVTDWPTTEDWPAGVAPLSLVVGVRRGGGEIVSERFTWAVTVP